jgi:hypothetical protein
MAVLPPSLSKKLQIYLSPLLRVVEDDAHGVALARTHLTDSVAHIDPIDAAGALHGTVVDREGHGIALLERHDLHARLHARTLLGQHKFSASEVVTRRGEQDCHLNLCLHE